MDLSLLDLVLYLCRIFDSGNVRFFRLVLLLRVRFFCFIIFFFSLDCNWFSFFFFRTYPFLFLFPLFLFFFLTPFRRCTVGFTLFSWSTNCSPIFSSTFSTFFASRLPFIIDSHRRYLPYHHNRCIFRHF